MLTLRLRNNLADFANHLVAVLVPVAIIYWPSRTASVFLALLLIANHVFFSFRLRRLKDASRYAARARELEFILQSAKEGIYGLDLQGQTTFANPAALRTTGHKAGEMIGVPQHALIHHTKPDGSPYKREQCHIYAALTKGTAQTVDDEVFWHKNGHPIPVEYTSTPLLDDHGKISGAVVVFRDITEQKKAKEDRRKAILELADRFEQNVKNIVDAVSSAATAMKTTARTLTATSEETRNQVVAVATASAEASTDARAVAMAAEHLTTAIAEIEQQTELATRVNERARVEGENANTAMQNLADVAQKIGQVTQLISAIAGQTSLLALNATIEAARAGEAGKGFAVVAFEVKVLANQTAKATDDIEAQITSIQGEAMRSVDAIRAICKTNCETRDASTRISAVVSKQSSTTQEMALNVQKAVACTDTVSKSAGDVIKSADETRQVSLDVNRAADQLFEKTEALRQQVDGFLERIRAG